MAQNEENPPDGFMAPKAWSVLVEYYSSQKDKWRARRSSRQSTAALHKKDKMYNFWKGT